MWFSTSMDEVTFKYMKIIKEAIAKIKCYQVYRRDSIEKLTDNFIIYLALHT